MARGGKKLREINRGGKLPSPRSLRIQAVMTCLQDLVIKFGGVIKAKTKEVEPWAIDDALLKATRDLQDTCRMIGRLRNDLGYLDRIEILDHRNVPEPMKVAAAVILQSALSVLKHYGGLECGSLGDPSADHLACAVITRHKLTFGGLKGDYADYRTSLAELIAELISSTSLPAGACVSLLLDQVGEPREEDLEI